MSNIYIQEPPTNGKVLLKTTVGDIDIELWSKEAPKACRNFIQLCMEGYYNGTIFHRVIRDFIAQGGDPTGTGTGGESIYGKPFRDEFHSRLRFVRRGLVCMANAGPHDNGSQFFFTFGPAPNLQSKHTIFGKVTGDTVYNMMNLQECETDSDDRPLYPHKINKTMVLSSPFDDIVPRTTKARDKHKKDKDKKESQSKATKNFKLLSFGEEAEEDEEEVTKATEGMKTKGKSSHDLLKDKQLSSKPAVHVDYTVKRSHLEVQEESDSDEEEDLEAVKESIRKKLKKEQNNEKASIKLSKGEVETKSSRAEEHKKQEKSMGISQRDEEKYESDMDDSERDSAERNRSRSSEKPQEHKDMKGNRMQISPERTREHSSERNKDSKLKKAVDKKDRIESAKRKSDISKSQTPEPGQKRGNDNAASSKERLSPEGKHSPAPRKSPEASKEKIRNEGSEKKNKKLNKEKEKVDEEEKEKTAKLEELQKEARQLRKELAMMKEREKSGPTKPEETEDTAEPAAASEEEPATDNDPISVFKADRKKYKEARRLQPKLGSGREESTLAILAQFKSRLNTAKDMFGEAEEGEVMDEDNDEEGHVTQDPSTFRWLSHKLRFEEHDKKVMDANIEELDRYEIFDPRNPINKRRREASKAAMKAKR